MPHLFDIAVHAPGDSLNSVVIPNIEADETTAAESAKAYVLNAIKVLANTPVSEWRTRVIRAAHVTDINE